MAERKIIRTLCPRACYDTCSLLAHVEEGRLVAVEGDPDHRTTRGTLCPRADRYVERVYHPDRLLQPLARSGRRGKGTFDVISWEEALERIAGALRKAAEESDPRSVLYHAGSGQGGVQSDFARLFFGYYGGYSELFGDLCTPAGMEAARLTFGALYHHPPEDLVHSRMVVLWGKNASVTSPHLVPFLERAREKGALLAAIDPRRTETARHCDLHLAPRPGTDGFLANAIAHVLIEEELYDREFVQRHVEGFSDYRWMAGHYEPRKAEETCGIPASEIVAFARRYAAAKPANVSVGFGVQRYRNGGQTVRAIAALQAITGNVGVSGGGFDYFNQAGFVAKSYPFRLPAPPRVRQLGPASKLGRLLLKAAAPPVRVAVLERTNPVAQTPFTSAVHYALMRLDFVCVIDQFLTDTARRADVVLPAKSGFEETDVHPGWWHGMLMLKHKCIDPPGEVRTEREIYRSLAAAMDYPTSQFDLTPQEMIDSVLPAGLSLSRLKRQPFDRNGADFVPFADLEFSTPSGKIEIRSEQAEVSWRVNALPFYTPPRESEATDPVRFKRYPLNLITPKSRFRQNSQWANDPALDAQEGEPAAVLHPDDAAARGIAEGDRVRVFNDRGEVRVRAKIDAEGRPGVVSMSSGRWISIHGHSVNVLTHDATTDMGYGAIFFDCLVEVARVDPEEAGKSAKK